MTVSTFVKAAAVRYSLIATLTAAVLVGCVFGSAFVWQKADNRAREAHQEMDRRYQQAASEAIRKGNQAEADRIMRQYGKEMERRYSP